MKRLLNSKRFGGSRKIVFKTTWNDASANDGAFNFNSWSTHSPKTSVEWYIDGVLYSTLDNLLVAADEGTLDGTEKIIELLSPDLIDTSRLDFSFRTAGNKQNGYRITAIDDLSGIEGANIIEGIEITSAHFTQNTFSSNSEIILPACNIGSSTGANDSKTIFISETEITKIDLSKVTMGDTSGSAATGFNIDKCNLSEFIPPKDGSKIRSATNLSAQRCYFSGISSSPSNPIVNLSNIEFQVQPEVQCREAGVTGLIFRDRSGIEGIVKLRVDGSNLEYNNCIDFASGIDWRNGHFVYIYIHNNNLSVSDVNRFLCDFRDAALSAGTTSGTILIHGTNAAPDGVSGGCDGLTAKSDLQGYGLSVTSN